jgi:hypothetical protein
VLLLGWMVAALLPDIPHPVAYLSGERGTGKSTTASHCVDLVDPVRVERRTAPSDVQGWAALARAAWVTYMDNLSGIPGWFSDVLCCAVTGGGTPFRKLYTDDDLHVINIKRPIMLSGIDLGAIRDDLADRMVNIEHHVMAANERRSERELEAAWRDARARNLGVLFDLAAEVLRVLPAINVEDPPRMADFTEVLAASDQILDTNSVELYRKQADELDDRALEADQVGVAVVLLMSDHPTSSLTPTKLLGELHFTLEVNSVKVDERWWPKNPTSLTKRLKRIAPLLRKHGIEVTFHKRTNTERRIEIRNVVPDTDADS